MAEIIVTPTVRVRSSVPTVSSGSIVALRLFDVAYGIDLVRAEAVLSERARSSRRERLNTTPPKAMDFGVRPVGLALEPVAITVAGKAVEAAASARLYDFGAITIALQAPIANE